MHKRILILGTTGIEKKKAIDNLAKSLKNKHEHEFIVVNFEGKYLEESMHFRSWQGFLMHNQNLQHQIWRDAWDKFKKDIESYDKDDVPVILIMHSVYVRENYGIRSALDVNSICSDFQPSLIINLLDDIFNMWWLTEKRSGGELFRGRPSFEQLLLARRTEILFGDLIAFQRSLEKPARHVICSINHPIEVLLNIIFFDARIVYLSFPISEPRLLKDKGNREFVDEINALHHYAAKQMKENSSFVFISPLAIDELPFRKTAIEAIKKSEVNFEFDTKDRWSLAELWNNSQLIHDNISMPRDVPILQIENTHGLIKTDIGWRDYKLVSQSGALAVFCPIPPGRNEITHGVMGEIQKATEEKIPCYVYQKKEWDPNDVLKTFFGDPGSMGSQPLQSTSHIVDTMEELFECCTKN